MDMAGPRRKEYAVYSVRNIKHGAWKSIVYVFLEREYGNGCMDYGIVMRHILCNMECATYAAVLNMLNACL